MGSLYPDGASFRSQPFRELDDPAGALSGHDGAAVEYWAVSTARDGTVETIAGVALLRFGADGRVVAERDYWNLAEGRAEPYEGWGPVRA